MLVFFVILQQKIIKGFYWDLLYIYISRIEGGNTMTVIFTPDDKRVYAYPYIAKIRTASSEKEIRIDAAYSYADALEMLINQHSKEIPSEKILSIELSLVEHI